MSHAELCVSFPKVWTIYMRKWGDAGIGHRFYDGKKEKNRQIGSANLHRRSDGATNKNFRSSY